MLKREILVNRDSARAGQAYLEPAKRKLFIERLFRQHYSEMLHLARTLLAADEEAEDIVQDVFSQIWENKTEFTSVPSLRVYLYNAVRNHVFDLQRKQKAASKYIRLNPPVNEIDVEGYEPEFEEKEKLSVWQKFGRVFSYARKIFGEN